MTKEYEKARDEAAKSAHSMIDDKILFKWEYVLAWKGGADWATERLMPVLKEAMEALEEYKLKRRIESPEQGVHYSIVDDRTNHKLHKALEKLKPFVEEGK